MGKKSSKISTPISEQKSPRWGTKSSTRPSPTKMHESGQFEVNELMNLTQKYKQKSFEKNDNVNVRKRKLIESLNSDLKSQNNSFE